MRPKRQATWYCGNGCRGIYSQPFIFILQQNVSDATVFQMPLPAATHRPLCAILWTAFNL